MADLITGDVATLRRLADAMDSDDPHAFVLRGRVRAVLKFHRVAVDLHSPKQVVRRLVTHLEQAAELVRDLRALEK